MESRMISFLQPTMGNILEPVLALLAIILPIGLAYVLIVHSAKQRNKPDRPETSFRNKQHKIR